jgi:adenylosuccinate synthase
VIVGTQWGDEGKGKITNALASRADMVVRFQGGSNAGHTVTVDGRPLVFHLLPSAISIPGVKCLIGPGVVIDPEALVQEMDGAEARGIAIGENFLIDLGAHMVMPYHRALEAADEEARGSRAIGTTRRGIGPAYADRYAREGVRIGGLADFERLGERLRYAAARKNDILEKLYGVERLDIAAMVERLRPVAERLAPHLADTPALVRQALKDGRRVIFEGAQGSLLDISFGTYPYVTSSHTTAAGVAPGTGVPPSAVGETVGIAKAYLTRVGEGPFPTEAPAEAADLLRERGRELGSTTGRPRRCGWLDVVALRYAIDLNGIERLIITKLDVLDSIERIPICVAYDIEGSRVETFPRDADELGRATPVFEHMDGWQQSTSEARLEGDLPPNAMAYLRRIEELTGARVAAVSVGAEAHAIVEFDRIL